MFRIGRRWRPHRHSLTSGPRARASTASRASRPCTARRRSRGCAGRTVCLKAENLQRTGSFKVRGAVNKIAALTRPSATAGVVAASAGNHGQAVAWAAREAGIAATVFMPEDAPMAKVEATQGYGAEVDPRRRELRGGVDRGEAYGRGDRRDVRPRRSRTRSSIAGQGTIGLELDEQVAGARDRRRPGRRRRARVGDRDRARASCAPACGSSASRRRARRRGRRDGYTIADGIAVKQPGELTRRSSTSCSTRSSTVTDEEIAQAIVLLLERAKLVVEGAGAVGVAALLAGQDRRRRARSCALLSGGNIDATLLISVARYGLTAGRPLPRRAHARPRPPGRARASCSRGSPRSA